MVRIIQQLIVVLMILLLIAALPMIITLQPNGINVDFAKLPMIYRQFFESIFEGSLGTYQVGSTTREISEDIGKYFLNSLFILQVSIIISLLFSLFFGIFARRYRITKLFNSFLNLLAPIPDFIIIIFGIILAVKWYKVTGMRVISFRPETGALNIWFPMILVSFAPTLYLFKQITIKYYQISGEDYIRTAVAKGMNVPYIHLQHMYKNLEPFVIANLTKTISLGIGNLFIIEYLLNVSGITRFLFLSGQVQVIAIGFIALLMIALIVYVSVRLLLYAFKRGFIYE